MNDNDYMDISTIFLDRDYTWRIGGTLVNPNALDIKQTVEKATALLKNEPNGATLEVGRLLIRKTENTYDVFTMIGEIDGKV